MGRPSGGQLLTSWGPGRRQQRTSRGEACLFQRAPHPSITLSCSTPSFTSMGPFYTTSQSPRLNPGLRQAPHSWLLSSLFLYLPPQESSLGCSSQQGSCTQVSLGVCSGRI